MTDDKINDIKIEFLSLIKIDKDDYIISLENVYNWLENPNVNILQMQNLEKILEDDIFDMKKLSILI